MVIFWGVEKGVTGGHFCQLGSCCIIVAGVLIADQPGQVLLFDESGMFTVDPNSH